MWRRERTVDADELVVVELLSITETRSRSRAIGRRHHRCEWNEGVASRTGVDQFAGRGGRPTRSTVQPARQKRTYQPGRFWNAHSRPGRPPPLRFGWNGYEGRGWGERVTELRLYKPVSLLLIPAKHSRTTICCLWDDGVVWCRLISFFSALRDAIRTVSGFPPFRGGGRFSRRSSRNEGVGVS